MMVHHGMGNVKGLLRGRHVAADMGHPHRPVVRDPEYEKQRAVEIGARIRLARENAGMSNATKFAKDADVDRNSVGRWEKGVVMPDLLNIETVARLTRVSIGWLISGESSPEWSQMIDEWKKTQPRATDAAVSFLRSLPVSGYVPSTTFLDIALLAFEKGLTPGEVMQIGRETVTGRAP